MQHDYFQKRNLNIQAFYFNQAVDDVIKDRICACMVLYSSLFDMQHDYTFRKKMFEFLIPSGVKVL